MASELLPSDAPLVLPYDGIWPSFTSPPRQCGDDVSLLGKVTIGERCFLGNGSVIRADGHFVRIGHDFHIGQMSTVHISHELYPTIIGNNVIVGCNSVVHACTIGDDCVIGNGVVILDGAVIENQVLIESGATIYPRAILRGGFVYAGNPAKPVRSFVPFEIEKSSTHLREAMAVSLLRAAGDDCTAETPRKDTFVARTARLNERVVLGAYSSVFFGCRLHEGSGPIFVGENSNIQDNTRLYSEQSVFIGRNTTIGHNVRIADCRIGEAVLIGIGSDLSPGTVVDDDVLLAAGSTTAPGQHLERGWLWAGRPARPIAKLDDTRRAMMQAIIGHYHTYAMAYRQSQNELS